MIFVTAIEHNEVLGAGFQMVALPAASDSARFLKFSMGFGMARWRKPLVPAVYGHRKVERGYHAYDAERIWHYWQFGLGVLQAKSERICTFEDSMPRSFRIDNTSIHHSR